MEDFQSQINVLRECKYNESCVYGVNEPQVCFSYRLMMKCWRKYASERPRFEEICQYLDNIIEDMKRDSYCESDSDDGETLSREGSKRVPTRSPSFKSGFDACLLSVSGIDMVVEYTWYVRM